MSETEESKPWEIWDVHNTDRGFLRAEFNDLYGAHCSIQESSLATQSAIWLGVEDKRMHLSVEMAAKLIVWLRFFVQSGALPTPAILGRTTESVPQDGDIRAALNEAIAEETAAMRARVDVLEKYALDLHAAMHAAAGRPRNRRTTTHGAFRNGRQTLPAKRRQPNSGGV